jgi:hypothetical protein
MLTDKIRKISFGKIYLNISFMILFSALIFPYTGLVDRIFVIVFITLAIVFKKTITNSDNFSTFALLYLTITVSFLLSLDKVNNYPNGEYIELKLLLYLFLFSLHFPIIKRFFRKGTRIISIVTLLVIYSPFLRLPMDLTRQLIGNALISSEEIVYFTKIHNNKIYGVNVDDITHPVLFVPTSDGYVEKYTYSFPRGGSMDNQTIDETLTFKFLKWLETRVL